MHDPARQEIRQGPPVSRQPPLDLRPAPPDIRQAPDNRAAQLQPQQEYDTAAMQSHHAQSRTAFDQQRQQHEEAAYRQQREQQRERERIGDGRDYRRDLGVRDATGREMGRDLREGLGAGSRNFTPPGTAYHPYAPGPGLGHVPPPPPPPSQQRDERGYSDGRR